MVPGLWTYYNKKEMCGMNMKRKLYRVLALLLSLACLMSLAACGSEEEAPKESEKPVDGEALFQVLLEKVKFETELNSVGEFANLYFVQLPAGAEAKLYTGNAYFADCLAFIKVSQESDRAAAVKSLNTYMTQSKTHFQNYQPDQVPKFDDAVIWEQGVYAILCVTADHQTAQDITDNASFYAPVEAQTPDTQATTQGTTSAPETTQPSTPATQETVGTTEGTTEAVTEPTEETYPVLTSKSGYVHNYGTGAYRVDDTAFENYAYDAYAAELYASVLNDAKAQFGEDIDVYSLIIPTAIGIVFPDDLIPTFEDYEDQNARMEQIFAMMDEDIIRVNCYDNLMRHRDEYLYFHTDYHWNGAAAYYAYETFCEIKGITPYTLDQREHWQFDNFTGALYLNQASYDPQLTRDVVHAYHPYHDNISMVFTDQSGNQIAWNVIMDVSDWASGTKYNTFAGGDNPITVYKNPDVTDGSVCLVIKESFGNALMPYIVDHYSVVYEIDYRYWSGNIADFAKENGVQDVIFANNIGMIRTNMLVAMLADNF